MQVLSPTCNILAYVLALCKNFFIRRANMPSKKPQFVIRTDENIIKKIKYIAEQNERSATQEIVYIIKKEINNFEKENGEIKL